MALSDLTDHVRESIPEPNTRFFLFCVIGGAAQIVGTALLVHLFSFRNFTVGTTYSKTEAVQTALFGIVILGDTLSLLAVVAIVVSLVGVMTLSVGKGGVSTRALVSAWTHAPALFGIGSGACFAISAVCYRAASLSLALADNVLLQAALTLACVTTLQTLGMGIYLHLKQPGELTRVLQTWRVTMWIGLTGMLASACWFTAMTIQNAAYVRALGQVELIFTFVASYFFFKERANATELCGIALVIGGLVMLVLN